MDWLNDFFETQNQIAIILGFIVLIWIVSSIIKNLSIILEGIEKGYFSLIKLIKKLISLALLPLTLLFRFFKWIFTTKSRHDYKQSVLNSPYNVYPEYFKIPWWRKLFSRKIRREAKTRFKCIEKCIETQDFINSKLKFITMIETSVGGGKSSFMAGLTHYKTIHFQKMIEEKIENTQKILYSLDWKRIDKMIESTYQCDTKISHIMDKILSDEDLANNFKGYYNNFRQETPRMTLLEDYVTAYCAKLRNNYVIANYKLQNRITGTFNIDLPPNLFEIKTKEARENYYIPAYSIITEDELSLSKLKNTSSLYELDKTGCDTLLRLYRQIKNETSFYVCCSQNISRNAKIFRELANSYFMIMSLDTVGVQKTFSRIYQQKEAKIEKKIHKKKYENKLPELKKQRFDLYQEQNKIFAAGFLKYTIRIAYDLKELDRFDKSSLETKEVYMPMTWAFGTYLKCQFEEFDKFLNAFSNKSDSDLKVVDSFFESSDPKSFEELIKNKKEEEEKKKEKEKNKKEKEQKDEQK